MKEMLAEEERRPGEIFDWDFIRQHTVGYEEFVAGLRATSWEEILAGSGLNRDQIRAAEEIALNARSIICCWAMGLTQHKNAVATIQEVLNFLLLGGNIGRPGAGPCPVRGHSNVQGDRTMGVWEKMSDQFLDRLGAEFNFAPPREHGTDSVDSIKAMHDGRTRIFFALGGNFLSATPDTEFTARALQNCRLTAHVSTKLNRSHLITGQIALILPCLGRTEIDRQREGKQFVTVEDSMGVISSSRGHLEPASEHLLSEPAIIAGLARAVLGDRTTVPWEDLVAHYGRIRDHIERVIPGFENFNQRIAQDVFYLPNPARDERRFRTDVGKAKFTVHPIESNGLQPGQYIMMTIRSHDQFNTTIYGLDDRYRGVYNGRRVVFLNPEDLVEAGLKAGQLVDLASHFKGRKRVAEYFLVTPFEIPRGCAATYFPEANVLVPIDSVAERSNTPTSKFVMITVSPSRDVKGGVARLQAAAHEVAGADSHQSAGAL
jgi:molybdopterin-dependent oxidoreductase alpha subunit